MNNSMNFNRNFSLQWHITDKCDQRCKHCYIYRGEDKKKSCELDLKVLERILDDFIQTCAKLESNPFIAITGGDPLLYDEFWEFLEIVRSRQVKFAIMGNPFHVNKEIVTKLEDMGCIFYQMSLDGLKNTHDYIRKPGSFEATIESLKFFKDSHINTTIMTTVSKTNVSEIPDLVDIVVEAGVNNFAFSRFCPSYGDYSLMLHPHEYRDFLDKMWKKYQQHGNSKTRFALKDHLWKLYLYENGLFNIDNVDNPDDLIIDGCHCGIAHITALADGTVYACRRSETPIGKVPEQSFYDIFMSDEMNAYRCYEKFEHCAKCELKNFCRGCPSVTMGLTGDFYAKDPQCWKTFED